MEREFNGPVFVETIPEMRECNGIVHIIRDGRCCAAMQISVFEKYMAAGYRLVRDFHARECTPIDFGAVRGGRAKPILVAGEEV